MIELKKKKLLAIKQFRTYIFYYCPEKLKQSVWEQKILKFSQTQAPEIPEHYSVIL